MLATMEKFINIEKGLVMDKKFIIEILYPPFDDLQFRFHKLPWSKDSLSPDMVAVIEVMANNREHALAKLLVLAAGCNPTGIKWLFGGPNRYFNSSL